MPLFTIVASAAAASYVAVRAVRGVRTRLREHLFPMGNRGHMRIHEVRRMRQFRLITNEQRYQVLKYFGEQTSSFRMPELYMPAVDDNEDFSERTAAKIELGDRALEVPHYDWETPPEKPTPPKKVKTEEDKEMEELRKTSGFELEMSLEEARKILGLTHDEAKNKKVVNQRFRALMLKNHPDIGGSAYVAYKINEAKEILMGEKAPAGGTEPEEEMEEERAKPAQEDEENIDVTSDEFIKRATREYLNKVKSAKAKEEMEIPGTREMVENEDELTGGEGRRRDNTKREEILRQRFELERQLEERRRKFEEHIQKMKEAKEKEFQDFVQKLKTEGVGSYEDLQEEGEQEPSTQPPPKSTKKKKKKSKK